MKKGKLTVLLVVTFLIFHLSPFIVVAQEGNFVDNEKEEYILQLGGKSEPNPSESTDTLEDQDPDGVDQVEEVPSQNLDEEDRVEEVPGQNPDGVDQVEEVPGQNPEDKNQAEEVSDQNPEGEDQVEEVPGQNPEDENQVEEVSDQNPEDENQVEEASDQNPEDKNQAEEVSDQNPEGEDQVEEVSGQDREAVDEKESTLETGSSRISPRLMQAAVIPYKKGMESNSILEIKKKLNRLGFDGIAVRTGYFGDHTERRVKEFQEYYGLTVNGTIDQATFNKIDEIISHPLQNGKNHNDLNQIKQKLNRLGYSGIAVSPVFGSFTERQVKAFQKDHKLPISGIIEGNTKDKIDNVFLTTYQEGSRHKGITQLKRDLNRLGFDGLAIANLYGSFTTQRVKEFQVYYSLKATGQANLETLNKIDEIISHPLQNGKSHNDLNQIKQKLNRLGYSGIAVSPVFGSFTERQVKAFQQDHKLPISGIIEGNTKAKIDGVFLTTYQEGGRHKGVTQLKRDLNRLGFDGLAIANLYGSFTTQRVKEFQEYYGLKATGQANLETLNKVDEILSSPLQIGTRNNATIELKKNLNDLGYGGLAITNNFGSYTEKRLMEFQSDFGLPISGIGDEITLAIIKQAVQNREVTTYKEYDVTLEEALNKQMSQLQQTDKYRNEKAFVHGDYIRFIGLTSANRSNLRTSATSASSANIRYTVDRGTKVTIQKEVKNGNTTWYEVTYRNETLYAHSSILNPSTTLAQTTARLNVRAAANTDSHVYATLANGTEVTILSKGSAWHEINLSAWRNPTRTDVAQYLNPNNNNKFQHLVLSASAGVGASELNKVLDGKGILNDLGQAFINGGKAHSVNEIYLISHALLETGHGTSRLAKGIEVGRNSSGNLVLVTESNKNSLTAIRKTYNMFGIGASDSDPNRLGAIHAYNEEWFTPEAAIVGGAKFIGDRYIHNDHEQNTLYKMRWNPASPGFPQYATDIAWAVKQTTQIQNMYDLLFNPFLHFDISQYK